MDAYLRLIQQTQAESYNEDMQALHDVLSGTVLDLYTMVSNGNIIKIEKLIMIKI